MKNPEFIKLPGATGVAPEMPILASVTTSSIILTGSILPIDDAGNVQGVGAPLLQVKQIMANLNSVLAAASATFSNVVKITISVHQEIEAEGGEQVLPAIMKYFPQKPLVTFFYTHGFYLPEALLQVEVIAAVS